MKKILLFFLLLSCSRSIKNSNEPLSNPDAMSFLYQEKYSHFMELFLKVKDTKPPAVILEAEILSELAEDYVLRMEYETAFSLLNKAIKVLKE